MSFKMRNGKHITACRSKVLIQVVRATNAKQSRLKSRMFRERRPFPACTMILWKQCPGPGIPTLSTWIKIASKQNARHTLRSRDWLSYTKPQCTVDKRLSLLKQHLISNHSWPFPLNRKEKLKTWDRWESQWTWRSTSQPWKISSRTISGLRHLLRLLRKLPNPWLKVET